MYYDCPELDSYDLRQSFIDERDQGRGYGKISAKLTLDEMRIEGRYDRVVLCYIEGNDAARRRYDQFGFREIGRDGNEVIMEMLLA